MKNIKKLISLRKQIGTILCLIILAFQVNAQTLTSPDKHLLLEFELKEGGVPSYTLSYKNKPVIKPSTLGLELNNTPSMMEGFTIIKEERNSVDDSWEPVWGEQKTIRNHYNELLVTLAQEDQQGRYIRIRFRLFN